MKRESPTHDELVRLTLALMQGVTPYSADGPDHTVCNFCEARVRNGDDFVHDPGCAWDFALAVRNWAMREGRTA